MKRDATGRTLEEERRGEGHRCRQEEEEEEEEEAEEAEGPRVVCCRKL